MTIKEAITIIKGHKVFALGHPGGAEAFDMAVEALEFKDKIVHCKDCKYAHMTTNGECKYCDMRDESDSLYLPADYYCADGELKV